MFFGGYLPATSMPGKAYILFLLAMTLPEHIACISIAGKTDLNERDPRIIDGPDSGSARIIGRPTPGSNKCATRIENRIESMKKSHSLDRHNPGNPNSALLDLAGYALHQPMRSAPYDMYVTSMKIHVPGRNGWFRIDRCFYDPSNASVETKLTFRDLKVSGIVKLYDEKSILQDPMLPTPIETCNMTLRLRQAGLGISALPLHVSRGNVELRTAAHFIKPEFVSVYAFGCRPPSREHRGYVNDKLERREVNDVTQEMEDVFVKGIQSLLTRYMEKQLQPALKDTLMANMGYTVSYGR